MRGLNSMSFRRIVSITPLEIVKHLVVGEAKEGEALRRKRGRAHCIAGKLFIGRVGRAVDLNDEPCVE